MSRFSGEDYEEMFPNRGELWWANVRRAIQGRRGQRDLRVLERALLDLPEKRLIRGRLARGSEVCAVGAYVLRRREQEGEERGAVLESLGASDRGACGDCLHAEDEHGSDGCRVCAAKIAEAERDARGGAPWRWDPQPCLAFVEDEEDDFGLLNDEDATARAGERAGMAYTLAWRIGLLNDEDFGALSPEERYEAVLAWVRQRIVAEAAA